jgi:predicted nucleotide-binding protein
MAKEIALTPLGTSIVFPKDPQERAEGLKKALFNIDLFKRFFTDYDNNKLPNVEYLTNTLNRTYGIPLENCVDCYNMIVKNAKELGFLDNIAGSDWIHLSKLSKAEIREPALAVEVPSAELGEENLGAQIQKTTQIPQTAKEEKPIVFISHSKNMTIVDQIKTILEFGQFDYRVAEETETTAIPIPEKVFGLMRECNCAIINVSADETEKKDDKCYGVNPNVLIEIGSAFLAYNQRVILLVDKRVKLPSNLQGLYRCEYEGDELTFTTALKLQKQLAEFRKKHLS